MNIEKILGIAADSQKMGDWGDGLSFMVNSSKGSSMMQALSDDDLMDVAGGVGQRIVKKKNNIEENDEK